MYPKALLDLDRGDDNRSALMTADYQTRDLTVQTRFADEYVFGLHSVEFVKTFSVKRDATILFPSN